ncbi:uncharacterized protein EV420DRAFT_235992 [Desarmillaria tabescens]|uniref:Uncharacterized protein n=1 Tax=Armillaria tabescens TaxID=1929756 RepID=A0AA39J5Q6_ARMTA|nr:uncharacterized protein EV420DRAFT_235992 [Desarmillaria tabescens]KAK0436645.1 hypothetical protein EV420DRAFT_235992 [Desarmillaria tabescens]
MLSKLPLLPGCLFAVTLQNGSFFPCTTPAELFLTSFDLNLFCPTKLRSTPPDDIKGVLIANCAYRRVAAPRCKRALISHCLQPIPFIDVMAINRIPRRLRSILPPLHPAPILKYSIFEQTCPTPTTRRRPQSKAQNSHYPPPLALPFLTYPKHKCLYSDTVFPQSPQKQVF